MSIFSFGRLTIALLGLGSSGCSFLFVDRPPDDHRKLESFDCTSGRGWPVGDVIWASSFALGAVAIATDEKSSSDDGTRVVATVTAAALSALSAGSAYYGFNGVSECRKAKLERDARHNPSRSASPQDRPLGSEAFERFAGEPEEARLEKVRILTDEELLSEIAARDDSEAVKRAALAKVQNPKLLHRIAMTSLARAGKDEPGFLGWDSRAEAAGRLSDQELLLEVARAAPATAAREAATAKITNQLALGELAVNAPAPVVRLAAVRNLADTSLLSRVAEKDTSAFVRRAAVEKLSDDRLLSSIARNDASEGVRKVAAAKVSDPAFPAEFAAREASRPVVRNVRWGMTKEEVQAAENGSLVPGKSAAELIAKKVEAFGQAAEVHFVFDGNRLTKVLFVLESPLGLVGGPFSNVLAAVDYSRVSGELDEAYGPYAETKSAEGRIGAVWRRGSAGSVAHVMSSNENGFLQLVVFQEIDTHLDF